MVDLSSHARVVIIGGGAVGCSILYHLGQMGWSDCLLLEKNELTAGSTWHAAGNCPNFSGSWSLMALQRTSTMLYKDLGAAVDYPMNYHVTGSIRLAHSMERMREFEHISGMARHQGIEFEMLTTAEMRQLYPHMETHDLEGGCWDPLDGDIDPAQLTQALAKGARDAGCRIVRFCKVTGARRDNDEWVVETEHGEVRCEYVVNAAGYRAAEVGRFFGRNVPCVSIAHQYLVTEELPALADRGSKLPLLRDPDSSYYLRQEGDGLLLGPYEKENCRVHWGSPDDPMPEDFSFQLYPDDLERIEWYIEDACRRVPLLGEGGIKRVVNGPIPYTPDGLPLIGPMPGVPNAFEACVFSFGIVQAGGAGKLCAELIVEGEPETDSWAMDPRRFTDHADSAYATAKAVEVYSNEYAMHFPQMQWPAGRPAKTSPLFETLQAKGAEFGAYGGWERADWFPEDGEETGPARSYLRPHWFERVGAECRHIAEHAGVLDLTGFSRFEVTGDGAAAWLDGLVTGKLARPGRLGLVYFASPKGKTVTEMSLTRFDENRFWLMTAAGALWHDRDWLVQRLPADGSVQIEDVTRQWGTLLVTGPKSRAIVSAAVSDLDLSTGAFSWLTHQPLDTLGGHLLRVSFAGELGWEFHVPMDRLKETYDMIMDAGSDHDLRDFGMLALESMRLEKGYRSWKGDLTGDYTMFENGLGRWVDLDKPDFVGREALMANRDAGVTQDFATFVVDATDADAPALSTVWDGDRKAGLVLSGGYGHRTEKSIALCVVDNAYLASGTQVEIDIYGERRSATLADTPALYDPRSERLRG
ncbi:MAG: FAD-dependent oxidoreductase [Rhodospirillaceae bacterium]|nr:FAD-dependent oxidoreductase [Rhodospirillaceae bacterium]